MKRIILIIGLAAIFLGSAAVMAAPSESFGQPVIVNNTVYTAWGTPLRGCCIGLDYSDPNEGTISAGEIYALRENGLNSLHVGEGYPIINTEVPNRLEDSSSPDVELYRILEERGVSWLGFISYRYLTFPTHWRGKFEAAGMTWTPFAAALQTAKVLLERDPPPRLQSELTDAAAGLEFARHWLEPSAPADLSFGVISDTHVGAYGDGGYPLIERLEKVLDWYGQQQVDAVAIVGDITDSGSATQFDLFKGAISSRLDAPVSPNPHKPKLVAAMGNHDSYGDGAPLFTAASGQKTNADYLIGGYHLITVNAGAPTETLDGAAGGNSSGNSYGDYSSAVQDWLRQRIDAAKAIDPNKPIFVFFHHPVQNTFYVSHEWNTGSFGSNDSNYFFRNDPQVVVFSGHIHSPNNDPRSIWQGGFTSVNTATLHFFEMENKGTIGQSYLGDSNNGVSTSTYPKNPLNGGAGGPAAQGMVVEVRGSVVTIKNYDFDVSNGRTNNVYQIPQLWTFDVSKPAEFPYTNAKRQTQKTMPLFDANTFGNIVFDRISIDSVANNSVTFTFDQALMPLDNPGYEAVHSYRFDIIDSATNIVERTVWQWSDFMHTARLRKAAYTQLIGGLKAATKYNLRIYAYSSFQQSSTQFLYTSFETSGAAAFAGNYSLSFNNTLNNGFPHPPGVAVSGTAAEYVNGTSVGKKAIRLSGSSYIALDTAANPFNYDQSFTIAFKVKVESAKGSDPALFSNKDWTSGGYNGFLFMVKANGIRLNSKSVADSGRINGFDDLTVASDVMNKWVHIAAVYNKASGSDGKGSVAYYANGLKVGTADTDLTLGMSGGQISYIAQSMGSGDYYGPLYNGPSKDYDVTFQMEDFLLCEGALSDAEISALAKVAFSGQILYQPSPIPAAIFLYSSEDEINPVASAKTGENGAYTLLVPIAPAGALYTLKATKPGYLSYTIKNLNLSEVEAIEKVDLRQLAGDVNGDGVVNAVDLTQLLSEFNREPAVFKDADIDGNGVVNAADLTYLLAGFNKRDIVIE